MSFKKSRPISTVEANRIIAKRKSIAENISGMVAKIIRSSKGDEASANFFDHKGNSFLFTKESVLRHFCQGGDSRNPPNEEVTHLRIVLGAHESDDEPFKKGDPTICITGAAQVGDVNQEGELTFTLTTQGDKPFDEHPPVEGVIRADGIIDDEGTFTIKIR